jgi:hypothetical protein
MSWANWMGEKMTMEREAGIQIGRLQIQQMPVDQLRALADSMFVTHVHTDHLLRGAMRRIAELELQTALIDADAIARQLQAEQRQLLRPLRWLRRWLPWGTP